MRPSAKTLLNFPKRLLIPLAVVLFVIVLSLAFYFRQLLSQVVLVPILYLAWLGGLIALVAIMALPNKVRIHETENIPEDPQPTTVGRIRAWVVPLGYNRWKSHMLGSFPLDLRKLVFGILAYRLHLSPEEVSRKVLDGSLALPHDVRAALQMDPVPSEQTYYPDGLLPSGSNNDIEASAPGCLSALVMWFRELFRGQKRMPVNRTATDEQIVHMVEYLEHLMEVENGNR